MFFIIISVLFPLHQYFQHEKDEKGWNYVAYPFINTLIIQLHPFSTFFKTYFHINIIGII